MDLVIGGAYQGKKAFALENFPLTEKDIYTCAWDAAPDWNARCLEHLERYVYYCVKNGLPVAETPREDAVLLCDDIFCGVVPIDPAERAWREETGRMLGRVTARAGSVHRVFCGLALRLK